MNDYQRRQSFVICSFAVLLVYLPSCLGQETAIFRVKLRVN